MSITALASPPIASVSVQRSPYRFSVDEYHRMIAAGVLREGTDVELLDGLVVLKMSQNPPHRAAVRRVARRIEAHVGPGWQVWTQAPVTLSNSEPEPDVLVAVGDEATYDTRHPTPADVALLVEVADSTLLDDRRDKLRLYAADGIVEYWIVNVRDKQVEVYTRPSGPCASPTYANTRIYGLGSTVPLVLGGVAVGAIAVDELFP